MLITPNYLLKIYIRHIHEFCMIFELCEFNQHLVNTWLNSRSLSN